MSLFACCLGMIPLGLTVTNWAAVSAARNRLVEIGQLTSYPLNPILKHCENVVSHSTVHKQRGPLHFFTLIKITAKMLM